MNFLHNDLGSLSGDEVVEVTLDTAANVKLMIAAISAAIGMEVSTAFTAVWQSALRFDCPCHTRGTGISPSILAVMQAQSGRVFVSSRSA